MVTAWKNHIRQEHTPIVGPIQQRKTAFAGLKRNAANRRDTKVIDHEHMFGDVEGFKPLTAARWSSILAKPAGFTLPTINSISGRTRSSTIQRARSRKSSNNFT